MKQISEIMKKKVYTVTPDNTIQKAIALMDRHGIKELPVVDEKNRLKGMVIYMDLLRITEPSAVKVKSIMIQPPTAGPKESLLKVLKLVIESGVQAIPIIEKGKIVGIVSEYDLLKEFKGKFSNMIAADFLKTDVAPVKLDDSVHKARRLMDFHKVDRLIVVDKKGKVAGLILYIDILRNVHMMFQKDKQGLGEVAGEMKTDSDNKVKEIYRKNVKPVNFESSIPEILGMMLKQNMKGIHVINYLNEPIGLVMRRDLLTHLSLLLEKKGVFVDFSGAEMDAGLLLDVRSVIKEHVTKLLYLTNKINSIKVHIKPIHDIERDRYEIDITVVRPGKKFRTTEDGYNILFTMQRALKKLETLIRKEYRN